MSKNLSSNKRIAKNTIFLYIRMGLVLIVSLFSTRIVLRALGVEDYGIYNVVSGFVSMFAFLNTSMSNGVQRFYNYSLGKKSDYSVNDVYNTAIQIQMILSVVLIILLETIGIWYMYNKMVIPIERFSSSIWVFHFSIFSLLIIVLQVPYSAAIMAYEKMDYFAYVSIFDVLAKLGIAYAVSYVGDDKLWLYGLLHLLVTFIGFILYFIYVKINFNELKVRQIKRKELFRQMLFFSGWNIFGSFAYMLKSQGLNMLLNVFFGPVVNAARGVSNMIMSALHGFQTNIVVAFRPQLVQSYAANNYSRVKMLFYSLSKISFILLTILAIPVILEIEFILDIWLGENIPEYTIQFTILVLLNMIVSSLNTPVSQIVHATGKMKKYQIGTSIVICLILPISWVALKLGFDATIVYWISLFFTIINQIVCNLLLKKVFDYSLLEYFKEVILPCCLFLITAPLLPWIITITGNPSLWRFLIITFVSVISSAICAFIFVLGNIEKQLLMNLIKRRR